MFKLNNKGNMLILVIVLGGASLFAVLGLISYAVNENLASRLKTKREQAIQIAEAGIAYYRWHLAHDNTDFKDGTSEPGPYIHEYKDKDGKLIGYYSLTIVPPENGSTIITLYSTGWTADRPESKRTLKVRLGFPAISDYAFLIDSDIIFSSNAFVHGKTHSNGRIYFDGTSDAPLSSAIEITGNGGPRSYWLFPVPAKDFASVQVKLDQIKSEAQSNGLQWPYLPASGAYGYQLVFKSDGTVDVSKVISAPLCYSDSCYDADDFGPITNYEIPTTSYIFVDDTVWVNGVVKGRPTLATIGNNIIINGNLTYLAKDGTNVMGIMTDENIIFPYNIPDPMEVNAALVTVNGAIFRPKYIDNGVKDVIDTQNFYGSRVGNYSGGMKYLGCGSVCSGFLNTNYFYDANLTYRPPAGFPVGSSYNLISWEEVRSVTTTAEFIPVNSIEISPTSATVPTNLTQQFTAVALPENATVKNITWSVLGGDSNGRISANGLYTAPDSAGSATILATSGGVIALATVTITSSGNNPPTVASAPASNPAVVIGTSSILSVLGHDDGGEFNLRYNWSIISKPAGAANPTFNVNNSNAAKNATVTYYRAGTYQFQVTITDSNNLSIASTILSVTVNQTLSAIAVSPSPVIMAVDITQQFSGSATDQFGQPYTGAVTYSWSANYGSITSGGLYTPNATGTKMVTASAGGFSKNVTVVVTEAATAPTVASIVTKATGDNPTSNSYNVNANQLVIAVVGASRTSASFSLSNTSINGGTLTWSRIGTVANSTSGGSVAIYKGIPSANLTNVRTRLSTSASRDFIKIIILDGAATSEGTFNKSNGSNGSTASLTINASAAKSLVFVGGWDIDYNGSATTFNQTLVDYWNTSSDEQVWVQQISSPTAGAGNVSFTRSSPATGGYNMVGVEIKSAGPGSQPPTISIAAAASPSTVNGNTTTLSVLGADDGGEESLTYTWNIVQKPSGASDPTFSVANNTNEAKNNLVTFYAAGTYDFEVVIRDPSGNTVTSPHVTVTVNSILSLIDVFPISPTLMAGGAPQQFTVTSTDQFGNGVSPTPSYVWSTTNGTITGSGLYTPPGSVGTAEVYARASSVTGTTYVTISATGGGGPNCTSGTCIAICGDGIIEPGEGCDDGNIISNDGCSSTCVLENLPGLTCTNITETPPSTLNVPIVLRDFKGYPESGGHADFERYACSVASLGLVQSQLVAGKPVFARSTANPSNSCGTQLTGSSQFSQWYIDTAGVNKTINDSLVLQLVGTNPAVYEYDSSLTPLGNTTNTTQLGFFPLDFIPSPATWGITPAGGGLNHNFGFTTEMHYWFTYKGGEVLSFSGDDDVWVFINGKLALDLGGLHPRVNGSITLSGALATSLGLSVDGAYEIALFHAERHTTQSNFKLTLAGFVKATTQCVSVCGDGATAPTEECDLGSALNGQPGQSCSADCKLIGNVL